MDAGDDKTGAEVTRFMRNGVRSVFKCNTGWLAGRCVCVFVRKSVHEERESEREHTDECGLECLCTGCHVVVGRGQ